MCGICGFWDFNSHSADRREIITRMAAALRHRGPDEEGFLEHEGLALGHRRLNVIDLEGGKQPMTSADGRVSLIFNGEIYNFLDIRLELEKKGRVFKTRSDTESLLRLYEEKGISCLEDLQGMFAFCMYDREQKKLFLAVDPFGKKPLYYARIGTQFVFSSEIAGLLKHPAVSKTVDPDSLAQYLAFEYVPQPRSMLEGVRKLEGGTYLEVTEDGETVFPYSVKYQTHLPEDPEGQVSELHTLLTSAIERRLISDVPLGVFLSGGLDSSALVALMRQIEPSREIKTFTIGFAEPSFDESQHAKRVSEAFDTEHVTETCSVSQMVNEHEDILAKLDEPLADASFLPTFMLCRLARRYVTVALGGDGGDELFLGYQTFLAEKIARRLRVLPGEVIKTFQWCVDRLPVSLKNLSPDFLLKQFFRGLLYPDLERQQVWLGAFTDRDITKVLSPGLQASAGKCFAPLQGAHLKSSGCPLEDTRDFYFKYYLQGDILAKVDRASMANSLEVRSPFLDDGFVRTMRQIPAREHHKGCVPKSFFRKAIKDIVPREVLKRGKKGFGIPIAQWIRGDLRDSFRETLDPVRIKKEGFFDPRAVSLTLKEHLSGKADHRKKLWTLYVFQKWKERL